MNILVASPHGLYRNYSSSFVHNQARAYADMGHHVRAVIPLAFGRKNDRGKRFGKIVDIRNVDGVEVCYVRYLSLGRFGTGNLHRASSLLAVRWMMRRIMNGFEPDVIHAHALDFGSAIGVCFKEFTGCPLVVTTHGGDTNYLFEKGQYECLKTYCDRMDAVAAVSGKLKERLTACGTETKIEVIHNGFVQHPQPADCKKNINRIIQVGNLIPSKRVDVTIRALAKLRETYPDLELTIIGQGPLRGELERLCEDLGVSGAVHFTGQLPNETVFHKMCEAGFFVMASKPEGFGIVYLEAMATGCVTIGTEGEGIADVITHGDNGFLVPVDNVDAIIHIIHACMADRQKMELIADSGKKTAAELTWAHNARHYETLFCKLQKETDA